LVTTLLDRLLVHNSVADIFTVLAQYQKYVVLKGTILIVKYQRNNCFTKLFSILCQKVFDSRKYLGKHFPLDQSFFLQFFNRSVSDLGIIPSRVLIRSLNRNLSWCPRLLITIVAYFLDRVVIIPSRGHKLDIINTIESIVIVLTWKRRWN